MVQECTTFSMAATPAKSLATRVVVAAAVVLAVLACVVPAGQAQAKAMTLENAKGTVDVYPQLTDSDGVLYADCMLYSKSANTEQEPTNVKVSKKSGCEADAGYGCLSVYFSKVGTSTVTYKWKGKKHTVKFVVHKWSSPAKSFTVGGKQYAGKYGGDWAASISSKYITGKVKVVPKSGWKVRNIEAVKADLNAKNIKNGKTTLKKKNKVRGLIVHFENKKSGQHIWLDLTGKGFSISL